VFYHTRKQKEIGAKEYKCPCLNNILQELVFTSYHKNWTRMCNTKQDQGDITLVGENEVQRHARTR